MDLYTGILSIGDVSIKTKIMNIVVAYPTLVTFGIRLTIPLLVLQ